MLSQSSLTSALTPSVTFFYMSAWEKTFTLKSLNTAIFKQVCLKSLLFSQFRSFSLQQLLTSLKRCIRFFLNCYTFTSLSPCQWLWSALPAGQPCPLQTESRCVDGPSSPVDKRDGRVKRLILKIKYQPFGVKNETKNVKNCLQGLTHVFTLLVPLRAF